LAQKYAERAAIAATIAKIEAAIPLLATRTQTAAQYRRTWFDDLDKAEPKAAGLKEELINADWRTKLQVLTALVDGVVQQLVVHTVGGAVTPRPSRCSWWYRSTAIWKSKRWYRAATLASCTPATRPRL
jgi:multidrug resistance efflux pump